MPNDLPARGDGSGLGWGFAVLAAILLMILISWGTSGQGRGWGRDNRLAHMMPPAMSATNGPATRSAYGIPQR